MKPLVFLVLSAVVPQSKGQAEAIRIVVGGRAGRLERYAAEELRSYLGRMTAQKVAFGDGEGVRLFVGTPSSNVGLAGFQPAVGKGFAAQEFLVRSGQVGGRPAVAVTGGSPEAVLWAAYALLEKLGVVFELSGEVLPPKKPRLSFSGIELRGKPAIAERGLRLHLNFPMDQSAYSMPDFLRFVDRMARLRLNYLMLHFYSAHPWFYFRYRDAETRTGTFFVGTHLFVGRYDLPEDMIGRRLITNRARYFPPELEGMEEGVELYRRTEERLREVMRHCHERGIKVAVSFEPLAPPADIVAHLDRWEKDFPSRDELMRDLTVHRLLACMDAYPEADEYQLISVEGSSDAPPGLDLKADLRRLCRKYGIPFDPDDDGAFAGAREAGIHLTPYNAAAVAAELEGGLYLPVVSALRFVDLALDVLKDSRVAERLKREGKQGNVAIYLPHAQAVKLCVPALRAMTPAGGRLQMMVDYGARGTADQMPTWEAFRGADLQLGVITWLEFDGSMFLPQAWLRAIYDCVRNARGLPVTTLVANHWRVSGLEADAAALSELPWRAEEDFQEWLLDYLARVFGRDNAALALRAYAALEEATLYARAHLFNVGFCYEGRYLGGFGYPQEHLDAAKQCFGKARDAFRALAATQPEGRTRLRAEYLANRCECARHHLDAMRALAGTEVAVTSEPQALSRALEAAIEAQQQARRYMATYAQYVLDRGDEGMLVNYHFAVVRRAEGTVESLRRMAVVAAADPALPVMAWDFERGDE